MDISGLVNDRTSTAFSSTKQELKNPLYFLANSTKKDSMKFMIKSNINNTVQQLSHLSILSTTSSQKNQSGHSSIAYMSSSNKKHTCMMNLYFFWRIEYIVFLMRCFHRTNLICPNQEAKHIFS